MSRKGQYLPGQNPYWHRGQFFGDDAVMSSLAGKTPLRSSFWLEEKKSYSELQINLSPNAKNAQSLRYSGNFEDFLLQRDGRLLLTVIL